MQLIKCNSIPGLKLRRAWLSTQGTSSPTVVRGTTKCTLFAFFLSQSKTRHAVYLWLVFIVLLINTFANITII